MTPTDYPDRVRALLEAATDGQLTGPDYCRATNRYVVEDSKSWDIGVFRVKADAALFAEAPTLARAYLAACEEVERLREIVRAVADGLAECDTYGLDLDALIDALAGEVALDGVTYTPGSLAAALRLAADRAAGGAA